MLRLISLAFALTIAGCATLSQLSVYTVSNAELEQVLDSQISTLQKKTSLAGIPLFLDVEDMTATIGPDGRDVVQLGAIATARVSAFGLNYPAKVSLSLEGTPYYDSEEKAIFVRSLSLLDSTIDAGGFKGNLAPVSGEFMQLINGYLSTNPVYRLDSTNKAVSLLSAVPLQLSVENGQLALRPKQ
ncbi:DUF1439 domain-containing protein [Alteromonas mediterranea]|uniref:Lipoprotein n=1 Tax=Alteromonas mediterranea TaxID=314275 RepID=A0AAC9AE57_9ALTE|nr:DUF1439 domain-containing protein [Alteromonas mediterranea]AFV86759.1 lipoprotein [Alteromonas mediterranea DE1]AGP98772.1 lipoprotein [Alteromonas mediterranea UM7]AGQ02973.1 lipoprotein [Alteromonas mediterranea UM4b]AMJ79704.1 hypothetical protein AV942_16105 [Alteromonas mediterranea]AMJ83862.1 hypothetical protein AV941_16190 [Alteromonas mediterranea]|tara:strand:+ start:1401 stop:1958 length:558 start_codon:yes stop_codon:yes gene_type:complete